MIVATTSSTTDPQSILAAVLADVNAVVPNFSSLVSSYRLLVGSAEEIHRIPGVTTDVYARSIERFDRTGVIIDILIDLLCCKISFSADLLSVTCAPVDLFRLLANRCDVADTPHQIAEEVLLLEVLRRAEQCLRGRDTSCIPPCTPPGPPPYTFATSCFQPPMPPIADFPPPVPPPECLRAKEEVKQGPPPTEVQLPSDPEPCPRAATEKDYLPTVARPSPDSEPHPRTATKEVPSATETQPSPDSNPCPQASMEKDTCPTGKRPRKLKKLSD